MNTEDDTFNRLKRTPYRELRESANQFIFGRNSSFVKFLASHNWTLEEFFSARFDSINADNWGIISYKNKDEYMRDMLKYYTTND